MRQSTLTVEGRAIRCRWDADARVWYVAQSDVPGLATAAPTLEALTRKLAGLVLELLEANQGHRPR